MKAEVTPETINSSNNNGHQTTRQIIRDYSQAVKLFSRNAKLYLLGSFLIGVNFHVFQLLLNLYLKEFGFVESQIGNVISARAVGMTLIAIPAAVILSRIKLKPVLVISVIFFAIFSYFMTSVQQLSLLMLFSMLAGMAFTFYRVGAAPFFMRNSTEKERTYLFSFSFAMMLLAGMAGSVGSGRLVTYLTDLTGNVISSYQYTLYLGIAVGLLALIPFSMIKASLPSKDERHLNFSWKQMKTRGGFYFRISISNFLVGMGAGLIIPFLNLYFRDRFGLEADAIGFYYFLGHIMMLSGILTGPIIVNRLGMVRAVVITQLLSIPFMLILSYAFFLPLAVAAFVFRGALMNLGVPIVTNLGMELAEKSERGLVNALLTIAWTSSWMVSAYFGGILIEHMGYTFTMNLTIMLYVISSVIFYAFFRKTEKKTNALPRWEIVKENFN